MAKKKMSTKRGRPKKPFFKNEVIDQETDEVKQPKKRGRPRKYPLVTLEPVKDEIEEKLNTIETPVEIEEPKPEPPPPATETSIVHHKKFGEIRVQNESPPTVSVPEEVEVETIIETIKNITVEGEKPVTTEVVAEVIEEETAAPVAETSEDIENIAENVDEKTIGEAIEKVCEVTDKMEVDEEEIKSEAVIRRSSRIKSIGILKKKEKLIAADIIPPVKVKSRWRRTSEMEMHTEANTSNNEVAQEVPKDKVPDEETSRKLEQEKIDEKLGLGSFVPLAENEYRKKRNPCKDTKRMTCDCVQIGEEAEKAEIGCGDDCLNRILHIECGKLCAFGELCSNKRFQRREYADCRIFKTQRKGFGLRAVKLISEETFIMEYVGEVVDQKEFSRRAKQYAKNKIPHFYFMSLKSDSIIDATLKGNISRFINHSCEPNAETQMWTVNGEPRIGFFAKRTIQEGEEITFDYCFERYGREAQRCYCEASNCRGWIGETPDSNDELSSTDDEEEDEEDEEREEEEEEEMSEEAEEETKKMKKKDVSLESSDTANESKSSVEGEVKEKRRRGRKKKLETRIVGDVALEQELERLRLTGVKNRAHTLALSRLMVRAEEWPTRERLLVLIREADEPCRRLFLDYHGLRFIHSWMESLPVVSDYSRKIEILQTLAKLPIPNKTLLIDSKVLKTVEAWESNPRMKTSLLSEATKSDNSPQIDSESSSPVVKLETEEKTPELNMESQDGATDETDAIVRNVSKQLLESWSALKEVFKIPKKERVEQMKEHEREADRGYREYSGIPEEVNKSFDRYGRQKIEKINDRCKDKKWMRETLDPEWLQNHSAEARLSKEERRRQFALRVLQEDAAAQQARIFRDEQWLLHGQRCRVLGLDPKGYPAIPVPIPSHPPPVHLSPGYLPPPMSQLPAYSTPPPIMALGGFNPYQPPPGAVAGDPGTLDVVAGKQDNILISFNKKPQSETLTSLPPHWRSAIDPKRSRLYFYHTKDRIPVWEPPQWSPEDIFKEYFRRVAAEISSDESSDEEEEEEQEEVELEEEIMEIVKKVEETCVPSSSTPVEAPEVKPAPVRSRSSPIMFIKKRRKRREGLVQEIYISPQGEYEKALARKRNKELKMKIRRKKEEKRAEKAKLKEKKKKRDKSTETANERRIKEAFKANIAGAIVTQLNHYRKPDCKIGRITNSEDFKPLARKLTHFVMLKELKHCQNVDNLVCNDSVKVKARDFVKKYMAKFGPEYERDKNDVAA